jgi:hypothetical protein
MQSCGTTDRLLPMGHPHAYCPIVIPIFRGYPDFITGGLEVVFRGDDKSFSVLPRLTFHRFSGKIRRPGLWVI